MLIKDLKEILKEIEKLELHKEKMINYSRKITTMTRTCIFKIHSKNFSEADEILKNLRKDVEKFVNEYKNYPYYLYNLVKDTLQEYAEVNIFYSILSKKEIPDFKELGIISFSYLYGFLDVIGELRRSILNELMEGKIAHAENLFLKMEEIFFELSKINASESVLPEFRRKIDQYRRLIDETKSLLITIKNEKELALILRNKLNEKNG